MFVFVLVIDSVLRMQNSPSLTTPNGVSLSNSDFGVVALLPEACPRDKPLANKALLVAGTSTPLFLLAANRVPRNTFSLVPDFVRSPSYVARNCSSSSSSTDA